MPALIVRFLKGQEGATAFEYAVLLALVLLGAIGAIKAFGDGAGEMWANNSSSLSSVLH